MGDKKGFGAEIIRLVLVLPGVLLGVAGYVMLALKLDGAIDVSAWWVVAPFLVSSTWTMCVVLGGIVVAGIAHSVVTDGA